MEIRPTPADLDQVTRARDGRWVTIEADVGNVVNHLNEIDHHLRVRFSEAGGYFVVYWKPDDGDEGDGYLVTTAQELDQRLVHLIRELYWKVRQPGYSLADELDKLDAQKKRERDHEFTERHGEAFERLAHAMRKDLHYDKDRIVVSRDV